VRRELKDNSVGLEEEASTIWKLGEMMRPPIVTERGEDSVMILEIGDYGWVVVVEVVGS